MNFLSIFLVLLLSVTSFAHTTAEQEYALNRINGTTIKHGLGTRIRENVQTAIGKYSYAVQGGSSAASIYLLKDLLSTNSTNRLTIPDNAVIKQVYIDVLTNLGGASANVLLNLQGSGDLKGSTAATSFTTTSVIAGTPINTAATMIKLTADRQPYITLTGGDLSAGIMNVYIDYVIGD